MILYLHGFNSSAASSKALLVKEYCRRMGIACVSPDLPHRPAEAIGLARHLCSKAGHVVAVGSSLGGYYATALVEEGNAQLGVLINPAVKVADKLAGEVGKEQQNYSTMASYVFTKEHVQEMEQLAVEKITDPSRYLLLAQKGDELLDCNEAVTFYAGSDQVVEEGGDHSFVGFERHLPLIARLEVAGNLFNPLT